MTASLSPDGGDGPVSQQETRIRVKEVLVYPVGCMLTGRCLRTQRASSSVLQEVGWYSGGVAEALKHESFFRADTGRWWRRRRGEGRGGGDERRTKMTRRGVDGEEVRDSPRGAEHYGE